MDHKPTLIGITKEDHEHNCHNMTKTFAHEVATWKKELSKKLKNVKPLWPNIRMNKKSPSSITTPKANAMVLSQPLKVDQKVSPGQPPEKSIRRTCD